MSYVSRISSGIVKKNALSPLFVGGGALVGLAYFSKHTFFLNYYKNYMELLWDNKRVEPSDKLKNIVSDVSKDVKEFASENTSIQPFIVPGLNTLHAGTVGTTQGGIVGLPYFFEFNSKEDIDNQIVIKGEKNIEELYDCLLLSDVAKKYVVAREILLINDWNVYMNTILPSGVAYVIEIMSKHLVVSLGIIRYPSFIRGAFYVVMTAIGLTIWLFLHNSIRGYSESDVENVITKLGEEYIEGGIEYCSKAITRNSIQFEFKDQNPRKLQVLEDRLCSQIPQDLTPLSSRRDFLKAHADAESEKSVV